MNRRSLFALALTATFPLALGGCPKDKEDSLTYGEALDALSESSADSEANSLSSDAIEITTNFTIGQAVADAATEMRNYIVAQLPCAEVGLQNATLDIQYGARPGNCSYKGQTLSGHTTVTVTRITAGEVQVDHTWTDLTNGRVKVTGTATVTWSAVSKSRHVVHSATWTRVSDGRTGTGTGDRTQTVLSGGLFEGIQEDGTRSWSGSNGSWDLAIDGVQVRWIDPVPQSGRYVLHTPSDKALTLAFNRKDADTVTVSIESGSHTFSFDVTAAGQIKSSGG